jgi:hypothetical protein
MRKLLIAAFLLTLTSSLQAAEVDFTGSSCEVTTSNGLYCDHAVVNGRSYWMEFSWDSRRNAFRLSGHGRSEGCPSMAGEWIIYGDESCDGSREGFVNVVFYPDGTLIGDDGFNGTWTQNSCTVDWTIEHVGLYFSGVIEQTGVNMAGEWVFPQVQSAGCWDADRVTTATERMKPTAADDDGMNAAGNPW